MNKYKILFVALPYATADLHLGRLSSTFIPADIFRRYIEYFKQEKCFLLSGLDCYGSSVYLKAKSLNLDPIQYVNEVSKRFFETLNQLKVKIKNQFLTSSLEHQYYVQFKIDELINQSRTQVKSGIKKYCIGCDLYLADRYLVDQKGNDHEKIMEGQLTPHLPYKCALCLKDVIERDVKTLTLKYKPLGHSYDLNLKKLNVTQMEKELTRNFTFWGLPSSKLTNELLCTPTTYYVWIQALYSYLEQFESLKLNPSECEFYYFYGKDNDYYHQVIWPQLIGENDLSPINPKVITFCRNYSTFKKEKMSSSKTNTIKVSDLGFNPELLRYCLSRLDTLSSDTDLSIDLIRELGVEYFKKYVNLAKRLQGLKSKYGLGLPSKVQLMDFSTYHDGMGSNDLRKSTVELIKFQKVISTYIQKNFKEEMFNKDVCSVLYYNYFCLLDLLRPFTPELVQKLQYYLREDVDFRFDLEKLNLSP